MSADSEWQSTPRSNPLHWQNIQRMLHDFYNLCSWVLGSGIRYGKSRLYGEEEINAESDMCLLSEANSNARPKRTSVSFAFRPFGQENGHGRLLAVVRPSMRPTGRPHPKLSVFSYVNLNPAKPK